MSKQQKSTPKVPARTVKLFQVTVQPSFIVEEDGVPHTLMTAPATTVVAAHWPSYKLPVDDLVAQVHAQLASQPVPSPAPAE